MIFDILFCLAVFAGIVFLPKFKHVAVFISLIVLASILLIALIILSGLPAPIETMFSWVPVIPVGLIVRYLVRRWVGFKSQPWLFAIVNVAGFAIAVVAVVGPQAAYEQATMKSVAQCQKSTFPVTIGTIKFNLPGSPEFVARDFHSSGNIIFGDSDNHQGSERFQVWCSRVLNQAIEPRDIALGIEFSPSNDAQLTKECVNGTERHRRSVCCLHDLWVKRDTGDSVEQAFVFSQANEERFFNNSFGMEIETRNPDGSRIVFDRIYRQNCEADKLTNNPPSNVCTAYGLLDNDLRYFVYFRSRDDAPEKFGRAAQGMIEAIVEELASYSSSKI